MQIKNIAERITLPVMGVHIDLLDAEATIARICAWATAHESRYVCVHGAYSIVTASRDLAFGRAVAGADLATPDGQPVAWMLRKLGATAQKRIAGPDLMLSYCTHAASVGQSIFLYGSTEKTLAALQVELRRRLPSLRIAGAIAPPFRSLTSEEDIDDIARINASGAGTVWVGLGCPKQELWMATHRGRVNAVMVGVGAAFDFHAGTLKRAPEWMRRCGLEWLHRLAGEPRRLWRRYLITNAAFILGAVRQIFLGKC